VELTLAGFASLSLCHCLASRVVRPTIKINDRLNLKISSVISKEGVTVIC
jgi:hypothetical protein